MNKQNRVSNRAADLLLSLWFIAGLVAFFLPGLVGSSIGIAIYSVFLVIGIVAVALRFLQKESEAMPSAKVSPPSKKSKGKQRV